MWIKLLSKFLSGQLLDFLMCFRILAQQFILILYFFQNLPCAHSGSQDPTSRSRCEINDSNLSPYRVSGDIQALLHASKELVFVTSHKPYLGLYAGPQRFLQAQKQAMVSGSFANLLSQLMVATQFTSKPELQSY